VKQQITMEDLKFRCDHVMRHEMDVIKHQMLRNGIELMHGMASFVEPHVVKIKALMSERLVSFDKAVIAVGTIPTLRQGIPFTQDRVFTSDGMLEMKSIPRTLSVIGAGVIGIEYASIFAALGVRVTVIDMRPGLLDFVDDEVIGALVYHLRQQRVTIRLGEKVDKIELDAGEDSVITHLGSGKRVATQKALFSIGRTGATAELNLDAAGLKADSRGRLPVNVNYQTEAPHIYAVGDVIGFPSLASTSMEQGRLASAHAFGIATTSIPELFPYGIYSIPEISMVGKTEEELTKAGIPYEIGKALYKEISRGQIIGDQIGMLKLLFGLEDRKLLGVHIIGEGASELVHIGQAVLAFGGAIDYFVNTVFNYPTLAEAYKVAALDGINRMNA
jgi:NAD(P) transhydrogenase